MRATSSRRGPDGYGCSRLAMMAYRAAGIAIPRAAAAQWDWGTQIPASQVQPGDPPLRSSVVPVFVGVKWRRQAGVIPDYFRIVR